MKFRLFAMSVLLLGAVSFATTFVLDRSRPQVALDPGFIAATKVVTDETFSNVVLASEVPVVVDFYGEYCAVCRQIEPRLAAMAKKYADAAVFTRVDVEDAPELIDRFEVRQVPTLMVIHQGDLLFHGAGLSALPQMRDVLEAAKEESVQ